MHSKPYHDEKQTTKNVPDSNPNPNPKPNLKPNPRFYESER